MVRMRSAPARTSPCALRSVETMVSSARWMPSSRSTMRASGEGIIPSRACGPMPPDVTRILPSSPRAASICSSSAGAITLRHVLAWQTTRTVLATRVGQRTVVRPATAHPRLQHLAELRAHGIDPTNRHRTAPDGEVVGRQLTRAHEVTFRGVALTVTRQPLRQPELRTRLLVQRRRQRLERPRLARPEPAPPAPPPPPPRPP